jgi:hypothetical protein
MCLLGNVPFALDDCHRRRGKFHGGMGVRSLAVRLQVVSVKAGSREAAGCFCRYNLRVVVGN